MLCELRFLQCELYLAAHKSVIVWSKSYSKDSSASITYIKHISVHEQDIRKNFSEDFKNVHRTNFILCQRTIRIPSPHGPIHNWITNNVSRLWFKSSKYQISFVRFQSHLRSGRGRGRRHRSPFIFIFVFYFLILFFAFSSLFPAGVLPAMAPLSRSLHLGLHETATRRWCSSTPHRQG